MPNHPAAGQRAGIGDLIDVSQLLSAFHARVPDPTIAAQRVAFGTSGHRGNAFDSTFNEAHVLAITLALCDWRRKSRIDGPLFLGADSHALSRPALACTLEVLAANGVHVMISADSEYVPTPAISHAILEYNRGRAHGLADGIVMSPSHNPPRDGGFKYNPPHGGPADTDITRAIEAAANALLENGWKTIPRMPYDRALAADTTTRHSFLEHYVEALGSVVDMDIIRSSGVRLGVDPMGGAGVHYWPRIAERYGIDLTVLRDVVDPAFGFMTLDWDGQIRMDPSSRYAMQPLIAKQDRFDVAFACDTDHDRHGIVTPTGGLVPSNDYLAVCIDYLLQHRPQWPEASGIGKTVVSSAMIDRVVASHGRRLHEVPVGFKWFVDGLADGSLCFVGEESAGATLVRMNNEVWTTDKDGIAAALLSAEIKARTGRSPTDHYAGLAERFGAPASRRIEAHASREMKQRLSKLSARDVRARELAGDPIVAVMDSAPGNAQPIGGIKVVTEHAWFAARPSGTEDLYKIYAESFRGAEHLARVLEEAQTVVREVVG